MACLIHDIYEWRTQGRKGFQIPHSAKIYTLSLPRSVVKFSRRAFTRFSEDLKGVVKIFVRVCTRRPLSLLES